MRLATITNWAYGITVALTLASGGTMLLASGAQERERAAVAERYALDSATSHIDEDVGMLSDVARQYAISGNAADEIAYGREAVALQSVEHRTAQIRDAGASQDELRPLRESLRWADALQGQQKAAVAARRAGDRDRAIAIMFAPEYERELDRIQANVEHFQERIDQRTGAALNVATASARLWRTVSEIVLGATGLLFLCVLYFVFRRRVLRPVVKLSDVVTRLAAKDYDAEPPQYEQIDEIGDMAHALRIFRDNGIERQRLERERDADRTMRDTLSRMTQRLQGCEAIDDLKQVVRRFVPRIVPEFAGRLYLLDRDRNAMVEACSWQSPCFSVNEFAPTACWALRRGGEHRLTGEVVDIPCGHMGLDGEANAATICLPLTAQNGMIGLLYFEVRSEAVLADIPDVHFKMLAENIGLALDNLQLRDSLRTLALADPLTTLANRRHLDIILEELATKPDRAASCMMLDIDHFKRFNDEHGHPAGDAVLRAVGLTLKSLVRPGDIAVRYGGEEFLILLPDMPVDQAEQRAEQIREGIAGLRVEFEGRDLGLIAASVGVASTTEDRPIGALIHAADAALLRAKASGRNRVAVAIESRRSNPTAVPL